MTTAQRRRLVINPDAIIGLGQVEGLRTIGTPIPRDARVCHRYIDDRGELVLIIESETFPATPDGMPYPIQPGPEFQRPNPKGGPQGGGSIPGG